MSSPAVGFDADQPSQHEELQALYHRLKNQLGIVLANAEVLESKGRRRVRSRRAAQLVACTLAAMGIVRELRQRTIPSGPHRLSSRHISFDIPHPDPFENTDSDL